MNHQMQDSLLLNWQMPWSRRMLIWSVALVIASALSIGIHLALGSVPFVSQVLGTVVSVIAGLELLKTIAKALQCMTAGIAVTTVVSGLHRIPWEDINTLKRLAGPLIVLNASRGSYVFLGVPDPVLAQLVSNLREATNARIIGFD